MQHVRAAADGQRVALLDAEAVLLVDDRDREVGELDVALDQRMRADGEVRGTVRQLGADLLGADRAGQQHARTPSAAQSGSRVRKCCSASVSVGAISAPCRPVSTARRSA